MPTATLPVTSNADGTMTVQATPVCNPDGTNVAGGVPTSTGQKAAADSLSVTSSTEDVARIGSVTETAPATDTASSGLNGRLQRIAQRITSLIALLPASLGAKTSAASLSITPASDATFPAPKSATGTLSAVLSGIASVTILASNASRKGASITNTDANALYLDLSGGTASSTSYSVKLITDGYYEVPFGYTGLITGIWAADGSGSALVCEFV